MPNQMLQMHLHYHPPAETRQHHHHEEVSGVNGHRHIQESTPKRCVHAFSPLPTPVHWANDAMTFPLVAQAHHHGEIFCMQVHIKGPAPT
jgi:hypothetical protein